MTVALTLAQPAVARRPRTAPPRSEALSARGSEAPRTEPVSGLARLAQNLLATVATVAGARCALCVVSERTRLEVLLRRGVSARAALAQVLEGATACAEAALKGRRMLSAGNGVMGFPITLGFGARAAVLLRREADAPPLSGLDLELIEAQIAQLGLVLSAQRSQKRLAQLRKRLGG